MRCGAGEPTCGGGTGVSVKNTLLMFQADNCLQIAALIADLDRVAKLLHMSNPMNPTLFGEIVGLSVVSVAISRTCSSSSIL
jgi:hypothetical protein